MSATERSVSVVLFDGFEVLDVFGPVELFCAVPGLSVQLVGPHPGPVRSAQGVRVIAEAAYADLVTPDILLVPGGHGTRSLVTDSHFLGFLNGVGRHANLVTSVCTGSALLAAAGLLEGYRATSNKMAYRWATQHGTAVQWVPEARWVHDRDRWTSSGVAAGMDMTAALITDLFGEQVATHAINYAELEVHTDPSWDPFAKINGLA